MATATKQKATEVEALWQEVLRTHAAWSASEGGQGRAALLLRREVNASLRKHPAAPAPAAMTPEERFRQECARRGVAYVPLPEGADDR